jgi:hypothetical protein
MPGSGPYRALTSPAVSPLLPDRKNWPSEDEVVPSPQIAAIGPDQLITGDALARRRHAGQPEVGGVGQDGGEQRIFVAAAFAGAQVGECGREAGRSADLVQQLGDADTGQHRVESIGENIGFRRGDRLDWSDVQAPVAQLDPLEFAPPQPAREAFQAAVEFPAARGEPLISGHRQAQLRRDWGHSRRGQQVADRTPGQHGPGAFRKLFSQCEPPHTT